MTPQLPPSWPNLGFSTFLDQPGVRWHVQIAEPDYVTDCTPTVLLLHGTGGSAHEWADVLPALRSRARVIAPDLPGHGFSSIRAVNGRRSDADVLSLSGMAGAVAQLMRALGRAPDVIAGHSAGAAVALRMTLDGLAEPRAVVGFNPALIPPPDVWVDMLAPLAGLLVESSWLSRSAAWIAGRGSTVRSLLESSGASVTDAQVEWYRQLFTNPAHCAAALGMMNRWNLPALARDTAGLRVGFTAYAGERDAWVPVGELATQVERVAGGRMVTVAGVGHLLPEEAPERAVAAILEAMQEGG